MTEEGINPGRVGEGVVMHFTGKVSFRAVLLAAVSSFAVHGSAFAQDGTSAGSGGYLDEIMVTATKKEQSLQDVPVAVSAVSGQTLDERGFAEVENLNALVPSISINPLGNSSQTPIGIRGIQSSAVNPGFEPAVGVVVDGVTRSRSGQVLGDFLDIERIEVLRGPQGTLFGKNTSAGVVHLITKRPEFEFGADLSASYGSFDLFRGKGAITGPITDNLAFRLAGIHTRRDGTLDLLAPGPSGAVAEENLVNDRNRYSIRGQLLFEPTDTFSVLVIGDFSKIDEVGVVSVPSFTGPGNTALLTAIGAFVPSNTTLRRATQLNTLPSEEISDWGVTAELNWDIGPGTVTSISSYREYISRRFRDLDSAAFTLLADNPEANGYDTIVQEVRYAGTWRDLDWLVGGYFFQEDLLFESFVGLGADANIAFGISPAVLPLDGFGIQENASTESRAFAFFTHNTFNITERLAFTGGVRYSNTKKKGGAIFNGAPVGTIVNDPRCAALGAVLTVLCDNQSFNVDSHDESEVTGTAALSFDITDSVSMYASYSRGYKTGGINLDRESVSLSSGTLQDNSEFDGEFVNAYELGFKSSLFGGRTRLNLTGFFSDYSGFQISSFTGAGFIVLNADRLTSKGVEFESSSFLTEGVTFDFNWTYLDAAFADNLNPNDINPATGVSALDAFSGRTLPAAPAFRFNGALNVDRSIPNTNYRGLFNFNFDWRGDQITVSSLTPEAEIDAYGLIGASAGIRSADDRWGIMIAGSNLADVTQPQFQFDAILQAGSFNAFLTNPRTVTVTVDVKL